MSSGVDTEIDMDMDGSMEKLEKMDLSESPSTGIRNFRHAPDVEGLYRFIYENDLREEAKMILEKITVVMAKNKPSKKKKINQ